MANGNDTLIGDELANTLVGDSGNDILDGGAGNDTLSGGGGNDIYKFSRGYGNDTILADISNNKDIIVFGSDIDPQDLSFVVSGSNLVIGVGSESLTVNNWFSSTANQVNQLQFGADGSIETYRIGNDSGNNIVGTAIAERIYGLGGNDTINGGAGADSLYGGEGNDRLYYDANDIVIDGGSGNDTLDASKTQTGRALSVVNFVAIENLVGGSGNDTLSGADQANSLIGNSGNDLLDGGAGNDILSGGAGSDQYRFGYGYGNDTILANTYNTKDVIVFGSDIDPQDLSFVINGSNLLIGFGSESLTVNNWFSSTANQVNQLQFGADGSIETYRIGNDSGNNIVGTAIAERTYGLGGNDTINGGAGADSLYGGEGNDRIYYDANDSVIDGGSGNDTLDASKTQTGLAMSVVNFVEIENLVGGSGNDTLSGDDQANSLIGNSGNDLIDGGAGNDILSGGAGSDQYRFGHGYGNDIILANTYNTKDVIVFGSDIDPQDLSFVVSGSKLVIGVGSESLTVNNWFSSTANQVNQLQFGADGSIETYRIGNDSGNNIVGTAIAERIYGLGGNDTINGGAGADSLYGGEGNDRLYYDANDIVIDGGSGNDTLDASKTQTGLALSVVNFVEIENLVGGSGNDTIAGDELANSLTGNSGNDIIDGGAGNDTLSGGSGNDVYKFSRGYGNDTILADTSNNKDTIVFDSDVDPFDLTFNASGSNLVIGLEDEKMIINGWFSNTSNQINQMQFGADGSIETVLIGNDSGNSIVGTTLSERIYGLGGNDTINGGAGDDFIAGGAGNDILLGGMGSDTYFLEAGFGTDIIRKDSGNYQDYLVLSNDLGEPLALRQTNNDLVIGFAHGDSLTMQGWYENDHYQVSTVIYGEKVYSMHCGGESNDTLTGQNQVENIIWGNAGNDVINSSTADDQMAGGTGFDRYIFGSKLFGNDIVLDFENGKDQISFTWDGAASDCYTTKIEGNDLLLIDNDGGVLRINDAADSSHNELTGFLFGANEKSIVWYDGTFYWNDMLPRSFDVSDVVIVEGGILQFNVNRSGYCGDSVTVNYATANGSAITGSDYADQSGMISFAPGETSKTISVATINDNVIEGNEILTLTISNASNDGTLLYSTATGTIIDNDFAFSISNTTVFEGGSLQFAVTRVGNTQLAATVDYETANGTAVSGSDYIGQSGTLSFAVGETNKTITVATVDDSFIEDTETLTVNLTNASNDGTFIYSTASAAIRDNDFAFTVSEAAAFEGGSLQFAVIRVGNTQLAATVDYETANGTAVSGSDYTGQSGTLSFAAGETSKTITVATVDDSFIENDETLTVTLSNVSDGGTLTNNMATAMIMDNDFAFSISDAIVSEDRALEFVVTRAGNTSINSTVTFTTTDETAVAGNDYLEYSGTLNFAAGETSKTISVSTIDDSSIEGNETMKVILANASNGGTLATSIGTGIIVDDDFAFEISDGAVSEGGDLQFTVTRTGSTSIATSVDYVTADGIAVANSDYTPTNGTLNFMAGETSKIISVATIDDYIVEGNETLTVILNNPGKGTFTRKTAIGNIEDNDLILGTASSDTIYGTLHNEEIDGLTGNDTIWGLAGNDTLYGNDGADQLDGGLDTDIMAGGADDDTYVVDNSGDVVTEAADAGIDTVKSSVPFTISANVENLILLGTGNINGFGNELGNVIAGNSGNNVLDGGAGADSLMGGAGDDTYVVDNSGDVVTEAVDAGIDTVKSSVSFILSANVENMILIGTGNINGFGNELGNVIAGNSGSNVLDGGAGKDTMAGDDGSDIYIVDCEGDTAIETYNHGIDLIQSSINYSLSDNIENLTLTGTADLEGFGNTLNNVISGNSGNNFLDGGTGADTLIGGAGNDTYIVDNTGDTIIENSYEGTDNVKSNIDLTLGANLENLILTGSYNLAGTGNALDNAVTGNSGDNYLNGGAGADTMIGGAGSDVYVIDNIGDVASEEYGQGTDEVRSSVTYTLGDNLENITLTVSGIDGIGNSLDNTLKGYSANTLIGGGGNDTYLLSAYNTDVVEAVDGGIDTVSTWQIDYALGENLENLILRGYNSYTGIGNALDNVLEDLTNKSTLQGGLGNDTYIVHTADTSVQENSGEGIDLVKAYCDYTLSFWLENLTLIGTGNVNGTGNADDNIIQGNSGNNCLDGGGGNDTLANGDGYDIYRFQENFGNDHVAASMSNFKDQVVFTGIASSSAVITRSGDDFVIQIGNNSVTFDDWYGTNPGNRIYNFLFSDGTKTIGGADNWVSSLVLTGSETGEKLTGSTNFDIIYGLGGNDTISGGSYGWDTLAGGTGNDYYYGGNVIEQDGEGIDTVDVNPGQNGEYTMKANVENLIISGLSNMDNFITGNGNELDNIITAVGGLARFIIYGQDGNDTLYGNSFGDRLDGGAGADIMSGLGGDDYYYVDNIGDIVIEDAARGDDVVYSSINYTLGANLETLVLTDTANYGTGNSLNNVLVGRNNGDDTLDGRDGDDRLEGWNGNDILYGGEGNDTLTGGAGNDIFDGGDGNDTYVFALGSGYDTIHSFTGTSENGVDTLQFQNLTLASVEFTRDDTDLVCTIAQTGETVRLSDWTLGRDWQVDMFQFSDQLLTAEQISLKIV